ncbi:MAG: hypothetical protein ACP5KD_03505 [Fervidobacterium sp.]|jgi:hypothetical protein
MKKEIILKLANNSLSLHNLFILVFTLLTLISSVGFSTEDTNIPTNIPNKLGIGKVELNKQSLSIKIDNKVYPFTFLDGMLIEDGERKVKIGDKTFVINVKTRPDNVPVQIAPSLYVYTFDRPAKIINPVNRTLNNLPSSQEVKISENPLIALFEDEFGNVSDVIFIQPLLEKLDILDSQTPITNITGKKFLLSSKSPYRLLGKVILTEKAGLVLEEGVTLLNALNSVLTIKGAFVSTGPITVLESGTFNVSQFGTLYLSGQAYNTIINSDVGALIFLDNAFVSGVNLSFSNFVVIRNSQLQSATINGAYATYIINSKIENLNIQNCGKVYIINSSLNTFNASLLSRIISYNTQANTTIISDLSEMNAVDSKIEKLNSARGVVVKLKNSFIYEVNLTDYSVGYFFKTDISLLNTQSSKYYQLDSKIKKLISK